MTFRRDELLERLAALETVAGRPARYVIAFSGGLDSTVLAHALATTAAQHGRELLAVHVDHGLQAESADWAGHCRDMAAALGIDCRVEAVEVDLASGAGPEAAARHARYAAIGRHVAQGDWLLSAHHRDDQAETVLLNLMRGSGPTGIAGIVPMRRFGDAWLVRPLLDSSRADLEAYADASGLDWVDDPSNADRRFDRNFLRHEIVPRLESRWPGAVARLTRSAELASEAAGLLDELAALDLVAAGGQPRRLDATALSALSAPRQRNLLRYAARKAGLAVPGATTVDAIVNELLPARADARPLVTWPGAEARRYRGSLYLMPPLAPLTIADGAVFAAGTPLALGTGLGTLELRAHAPLGLSDRTLARGLSVRRRRGGEEIKPSAQAHTRTLKKLLQDEGIVPWMRDRVPLVYAGDDLVAVGDLAIAANAASEPGTAVLWHDRPALR